VVSQQDIASALAFILLLMGMLFPTTGLNNPYLLFLCGIVVLVSGADRFTEGASNLGIHFGVPAFLVGSTIVALGTSLPELGASLMALTIDKPDLVLGNIVGSNIANITLVLGICGMVHGIDIKWNVLLAEVPFLLVSTFAFVIVSLDGKIVPLEGVILLMMYVAYVTNLRGSRSKAEEPSIPPRKAGMLVLLGIVFVFLGSRATVTGAVSIGTDVGRMLGIADDVLDVIIGFTIVAIGTSLPELVTSLISQFKGQEEMITGGIMGSNNFNILVVIGICSIIYPSMSGGSVMMVPPLILSFYAPAMVLVTLLLVIMLIDRRLTRFEASLLFLLYLALIVNIVGSGTGA